MAGTDPTLSTLRVDPVVPEMAVVRKAAAVLAAGGLVAFPTDTFYGLAIDPRMAGPVEQLLRVKSRSTAAAIPLIAADLSQVESDLGVLTLSSGRLARRFWPGPLTLVVDTSADLDPRLLAGGKTIAVRVPDHAVARALAAALGHPITSTSANWARVSPSTTAAGVVTALGSEVTLVLDAGPSPGGAPSTIVDARGRNPLLLRAGVVPWDCVVQSLV
jgi:L-threonylcarbamoyladenylate synthase